MGFSTVNSVVEGKLLRGDSTKSRQMQDQVVAAAAKGGNNMGEQVAPHTHKLAKHPHNTEKEKKEKMDPATGDVDDIASIITADADYDILSNSTTSDDYDIVGNSTAVDDDDVASNTTAAVDDEELDESDADEEEGEDEIRY